MKSTIKISYTQTIFPTKGDPEKKIHRFQKKQSPKVNNRSVPLHFVSMNKLYNGQLTENIMPQRWAYVPPLKNKKYVNSKAKSLFKIDQNMTLSDMKSMMSTSELILKKYLDRKKKKSRSSNGFSLHESFLTTDSQYHTTNPENKSKKIQKNSATDDIIPSTHIINDKYIESIQYTTEITQYNQKHQNSRENSLEKEIIHSPKRDLQNLMRLTGGIKSKDFAVKKINKALKAIQSSKSNAYYDILF